jgi:hypothetical protein
MAALPYFLNENFRGRILRRSRIIHTIREDIIITGFQRFFENLFSQLKPFTKNGNIAKSCK